MIHKDYDLDKAASSKKEVLSSWSFEEDYKNQKQILIKHNNITSRLVWHPKGDYLATMAHNL